MKRRIVIIDDEKPITDILQFHFQREGFCVQYAYNSQKALKLVKDIQPDIALLDLMLPNCEGMKICYEIREK